MGYGGTMDESAAQEWEPPLGRDRECGTLDRLLDSLDERGAALLLWGDPGIGKSTLLDYTARRSRYRVLRIRGIESEAVLPYTVLADLLLPLREHFQEVAAAQRRALEGCLALADVADPNPYAVCAGALSVLAAAGEPEPLVVLVDDLHWVDPSSRRVLHFIARRLSTERVALVMTVRPDGREDFLWEGVPELLLAPLDDEGCRQLLKRRRLDPTGTAAAQLIPLSAGNPLVLVEYAEMLARAEVRGGKLGEQGWLTPGPLVERAWRGRMRSLPRDTRDALVFVAASHVPGLVELEQALTAVGLSLDALQAAEEAGLVRAEDTGFELRHPVLRPLVLSGCPVAQRLRAYRVLAEVSSGELRTWYLACAAPGPDETVAAALADHARQARQRGAFDSAARVWHRAAELSPLAADRAVRLLRAAEDAFVSGASHDAAHWCDQALRHADEPRLTADIELLRGQIRSWAGDPLGAYQLLLTAAGAAETADQARACALYGAAVMPAAMGGRLRQAVEAADRCGELAEARATRPERRLAAVMQANALALTGHVRQSRRLLRECRAALVRAWPLDERQAAVLTGQALSWVDEEEEAREVLGVVVDRARREGIPGLLPFALVARCEVESWNRWAAARADGSEALRWAREFGHKAMTGYALTSLARLEGLRGNRAACEELIAHYEAHCGEGIPGLDVFAHSALGSAALAAGEPRPCSAHLERAFTTAERTGLDNPHLMPFVADLAEAHSRTGNRDRALKITHWLGERARSTGLAWPTLAHARCRSMLAESADIALSWLAVAEQAHARRAMPYELARTRLVCGETLRRLRRPAAAREPLQAAQRTFRAMGAVTWAERATAELAASGQRGHSGSNPPPQVDLLTAQEFQVARAIGEGLSNVEAAGALFLSRKTVEAHLTRVYRKLGIRSRSDLARCLAQAGVVG
ncbi:AAA family ATPase [Streptomyces griseorubiginosus]|uniref:AAA family ATPase n=1 Tax=Streptomyces griseorubiginosus TaxID=67304 RepID=UPI0036EAA8C2